MATGPTYINGQAGNMDLTEEIEEALGDLEIEVAWGDVTGKPSQFPPAAHTHTSADITDATAVGVDVLTAADAGAARTAIGAGTSDLTIGTTANTAKAGNYQPTWAQVSDKPSTFAPAAHTHEATEIDVAAYEAGGITAGDLQVTLEALADRIATLEAA